MRLLREILIPVPLLLLLLFTLVLPARANLCEDGQIAVASPLEEPFVAVAPRAYIAPKDLTYRGKAADPLEFDSARQMELLYTRPPQHLYIRENVIQNQIGPIRDTLGSGGEGAVYAVTDRLTGRQRTFKTAVSAVPLIRDNFYSTRLRNAHTAQHPDRANPFLETQYFPDYTVLEMPRAQGDVGIYDCGPENLPRALDTIAQMNAAVVFANSHSVVHRDVKPANFLRMGENHVILADFGMAAPEGGNSSPLEVGKPSGTRGYRTSAQQKGEGANQEMDAYGLRLTAIQVALGRKLEDSFLTSNFFTQSRTYPDGKTYTAFKRSPHSIDSKVPKPISLALWRHAKTAQEFQARFELARTYIGRDEAYVREVFSADFTTAIQNDPVRAAAEFLTSPELIQAAKDGWLQLEPEAKHQLWAACARLYRPKRGDEVPVDHPSPPIQDEALKKKIIDWTDYQNFSSPRRWLRNRISGTPPEPW